MWLPMPIIGSFYYILLPQIREEMNLFRQIDIRAYQVAFMAGYIFFSSIRCHILKTKLIIAQLYLSKQLSYSGCQTTNRNKSQP
jgi:hypothetical protein